MISKNFRCSVFDLKMVLVHWMWVKLEADCPECALQGCNSFALLCSAAAELSFCRGGYFSG